MNNKISLQAMVIIFSCILLLTIPWREREPYLGHLDPLASPLMSSVQDISNFASAHVRLIVHHHNMLTPQVGHYGSFYCEQGRIPPVSFTVVESCKLDDTRTMIIAKIKRSLPPGETALFTGKVFMTGRSRSFLQKSIEYVKAKMNTAA